MYQLLRDGEVLFEGTANECYIHLHKIQPSSWHHALKYEGYSVVPKEGESNE